MTLEIIFLNLFACSSALALRAALVTGAWASIHPRDSQFITVTAGLRGSPNTGETTRRRILLELNPDIREMVLKTGEDTSAATWELLCRFQPHKAAQLGSTETVVIPRT